MPDGVFSSDLAVEETRRSATFLTMELALIVIIAPVQAGERTKKVADE
jgi:tryptophan synthase alpha subunit